MRQKVGKKEHKGIIARCNICKHEYTIDDLVLMCLSYWNSIIDSCTFQVDCWTSPNESSDENEQLVSVTGKKKLEELLFILSTPGVVYNSQLCETITNVVRNLHGYQHAIQCFKKGNECRYKLPALYMTTTNLHIIEEIDGWYDYLGKEYTYRLYDLLIKRSEFDVFQNQSCRAISLSKLGSNSNSQICVSGQKAIYTTKYPTKPLQKEDESEYENVQHFASVRLGDR